MVTFFLSQFSSITLSYFNYENVTKIDLMEEDIKINYYTELRDERWIDLFEEFYCNNRSIKRVLCYDELLDYLRKLLNKDINYSYGDNELTIDQLLDELIKFNLLEQFYNVEILNYTQDSEDGKYKMINHIYQGYIIKDIYTNVKPAKYWTYYFNKTIKEMKKVYYFINI